MISARASVSKTYAWTKQTGAAAYAPRDGARLIAVGSRLYQLGGWNPPYAPWVAGGWTAGTTNEIWYSDDLGVTWTMLLNHDLATTARWSPRHEFGCVQMGGYVYVIGGDNNSNAYQIDVWRAPESDLTSWTRMTANWGVGNRVLYAVWARGTALYIGGGQTLREFTGEAVQVYYDDVWRSDNNGATWTQIATGTPLASHGACGVADWQGRTWFIAGGKYKVQFTRDVHSTADGITFTAHTAPPFDKRYYTDAAVVDGELVLFGGYSNTSQYGEPGGSDASGLVGYNRADLWRTRDGELWTRNPSELGTAAALLSHASGVVGIDKKLIVAAGNHLTKEVWKHAEAA